MTTTAFTSRFTPEFVAFAYDGWSVLRIGRTEHAALSYEATHPELPGDVLVAGSLGEVRDLIDGTRQALDEEWVDSLGPVLTEPSPYADAQAAHEADICRARTDPDGAETHEVATYQEARQVERENLGGI